MRISRVTAWSLGIAVSLAVAGLASAADKAGRLSGTVLSADKGEITLVQGTVHRVITYTGETKFTMGSPSNTKTSDLASADQVKAGNYLVCVGSWDAAKLAATSCTVRPSKRP